MIDYSKLWLTLLRTGIKSRFSVVRSEFFMTIATIGKKIYSGKDAIDACITGSCFAERGKADLLKDVVTGQISETQPFKYFRYETIDKSFAIDYFAKVGWLIDLTKLPVEHVDVNKTLLYESHLRGICLSNNLDETGEGLSTLHCILIGETSDLTPEEYPALIKHELSHACLFETIQMLESGAILATRPVSETWSEMDKATWEEDLDTLTKILQAKDAESTLFEEFVCEFLMYESDGSIKVPNPVIESRSKPKPKKRRKKTKQEIKPKVTFKTLTPYDRFQEDLFRYKPEYKAKFQEILNNIKATFGDYDKFTYLTK